MGLFASRPEEPTEWAGLPSEPLPPRTAAETLADGGLSADIGDLAAMSIESIVIPVAPQTEIVEEEGAPDLDGAPHQ